MAESGIPKESAIVEVSTETNELVETRLKDEPDELKQATKELIEALKRKTEAEVKEATAVTQKAYETAVTQAREAYLNFVQQTIKAVEENRIVDPEGIDKTLDLIKSQTEKNWDWVTKEVTDLGDRITEAAKAAWEKLTAPRPEGQSDEE
ncbi:hypothetical protein [Trichothermofontia sp.]